MNSQVRIKARGAGSRNTDTGPADQVEGDAITILVLFPVLNQAKKKFCIIIVSYTLSFFAS